MGFYYALRILFIYTVFQVLAVTTGPGSNFRQTLLDNTYPALQNPSHVGWQPIKEMMSSIRYLPRLQTLMREHS